jgi:molybdopterin synthase catalytic subunit
MWRIGSMEERMSNVVVQVTEDPISLGDFSSHLSDSSCGAEAHFVGVVRDRNEGKAVSGITYDVHVPLAEKAFREICEEIQVRLGREFRIAVAHRIGFLRVGEASIVIGVSSPHRDAAFTVCRYIIEETKKRVPIWKKEHYVDGDFEWLKGATLQP